jgi:hypothetical protein
MLNEFGFLLISEIARTEGNLGLCHETDLTGSQCVESSRGRETRTRSSMRSRNARNEVKGCICEKSIQNSVTVFTQS